VPADDCPTELQQYREAKGTAESEQVKGPKVRVQMRECDEDSLKAWALSSKQVKSYRTAIFYSAKGIDPLAKDKKCGLMYGQPSSGGIQKKRENYLRFDVEQSLSRICPIGDVKGKPKARKMCIPKLGSWKVTTADGVLKEAQTWCTDADLTAAGRVRGVGCFGDKYRQNPSPKRPLQVLMQERVKQGYGTQDYEDLVATAQGLVCRGKCFNMKSISVASSCRCYDGEQISVFYDRRFRYRTLKALASFLGGVHHLDGLACSFTGKGTSKSYKWSLIQNKYFRNYLYPKYRGFKCCGELSDKGEARPEGAQPKECRACCGLRQHQCSEMGDRDYSQSGIDECLSWLVHKPKPPFKKNPCKNVNEELGENWGRRRKTTRRRRFGGGMLSSLKKKIKKVAGGVKKTILRKIAKKVIGFVNRLSKKFYFYESWEHFRNIIQSTIVGDKTKQTVAVQKIRKAWYSGKLASLMGKEVMPLLIMFARARTSKEIRLARKALRRKLPGMHPFSGEPYEHNGKQGRIPMIPVPKSALKYLIRRMATFAMEAEYSRWRSFCEGISGGVAIAAPTSFVSTQSFDAWSARSHRGGGSVDAGRGFMDGTGKAMGGWVLYAVKAQPDWWVAAARTHSTVRKCHLDKNGRCNKLVQPLASAAALMAPWICIFEKSNECPMVPKKDNRGYHYPIEIGGSLSQLAKQRLNSIDYCDVGKSRVPTKPGKQFCGPNCVARMKLVLDTCSTCCCKGGYLKAGVDSSLIADDGKSLCTIWMGTLDTLIRMYMAVVRNLMMTNRFKAPCYLPFEDRTRTPGRTSQLGSGDAIEQGRRGGQHFGTTGSFSFVSGNRAGNSERFLLKEGA